ncbi:protein VACUOLELESS GAMETOPHYTES-like [Typha angustifolia]|uniref:protein VACUOLELESS GAMETOPHYTES-like n=1 Tax=Typha angustifolia TaxID=59011 RepID=UPI003C2CD1D0
MARLISHCTHPNHELVKILRETFYTCDMCKQHGIGIRYRCDDCDFDLHQHCAFCPDTIDSYFAHPWHTVTLSPPTTDSRVCDICREPVKGYSYRCVPCGFDLHPFCALIPQTAKTKLHSCHRVTMTPASQFKCNGCGEQGCVWRYRCGPCGVNFHPKCVHGSPFRKLSTT